VADTSSPGILVIIDDQIYYKKVGSLAEVQHEIEAIKGMLVGRSGYARLGPKDKVQLNDSEADDIKALLSAGITIRPLGR
jgi:hypothetical protein